MEYNQLKQYGTVLHEDTPNTSTPVARMIPSTIDAQYAKLFLAAPDMYEALKELPQPKSLLEDAAYTGGDVPKKWINDRGHFNDGYNQALKDVAKLREQALAKAGYNG